MAGRLGLRFGFYLELVATAKIDTAVCVFAAVEFEVELEVLELVIVDELVAMAWTDDGAVLHRPLRLAGLIGMPAGEVLAVEECYGFAPLRRARIDKRGCAIADPLPSCAVRPVDCTGEVLAG